METKSIKMRIDRIEEGLAVAYSENGEKYTVCQNDTNLKENDLIMATVNQNGEVVAVETLKEETVAKKQQLRSKLKNLFNK